MTLAMASIANNKIGFIYVNRCDLFKQNWSEPFDIQKYDLDNFLWLVQSIGQSIE